MRADIVREMRETASRGGTVPELVTLVQAKAGYNDGAILPVLWYFSKAFCLPLPIVLPLREWFFDRNDEAINALLLPEIEQNRAQWSLVRSGGTNSEGV